MEMDRVPIKGGHIDKLKVTTSGSPKYAYYTFSEKTNTIRYKARKMYTKVHIGDAYYHKGLTKYDGKANVYMHDMSIEVVAKMTTLKMANGTVVPFIKITKVEPVILPANTKITFYGGKGAKFYTALAAVFKGIIIKLTKKNMEKSILADPTLKQMLLETHGFYSM